MANQQHLEILKNNVDAWNRWRSENGQIIPDLSGANLEKLDLSFANLSGSNLSGASLVLANVEGADLRWADLSGANLVGARLIGIDISEAVLAGTDLSTAEDLTEEQLSATRGDAKTVLPEGIQRPEAWLA